MSFTLWMKKNGGGETLLAPYQKGIIRILEITGPVALGSREIWESANDMGHTCSRASVINFLRLLRTEGIIKAQSASGKGGMHELYRLYTGASEKNIYYQIGIKMLKVLSDELEINDKQWSSLLANSERTK